MICQTLPSIGKASTAFGTYHAKNKAQQDYPNITLLPKIPTCYSETR